MDLAKLIQQNTQAVQRPGMQGLLQRRKISSFLDADDKMDEKNTIRSMVIQAEEKKVIL